MTLNTVRRCNSPESVGALRELADFLVRKARIATNPGHWFGREGAGLARISIACPRSVLVAALGQLARAVGDLGA